MSLKLTFLKLSMLLAGACGAEMDHGAMDSELEPYANQVTELAEAHGVKAPTMTGMIFDAKEIRRAMPDSPYTVGMCRVGPTRKQIYIDRKAWNKYSEQMRLRLVLHEQGHCAWLLGHTDHDGIMNGYLYPLSDDEFATELKKFFRRLK